MNSYAAMAEISAARPVSVKKPRRLFARLLPLLALACWIIAPAPASAATISSGQTVSGTIANGTQIDSYDITPNMIVGSGIEASIGTDATPLVGLQVNIYNSGHTSKCTGQTSTNTTTGPYFAKCLVTSAGVTSGGKWTVEIKRYTGTSGAGYNLKLVVTPAATAFGTPGGTIYPGLTYSGSVSRGDMQLWTVKALKVNKGTVTMTWTGGPAGSSSVSLTDWEPNGGGGGGTSVNNSTTTSNLDFAGTGVAAGNTTFAITKLGGADGTAVSYTLSVSGVAVVMPTDAEADGSWCFTCLLKKVLGITAMPTGGAAVGDPINIATGNLFEHYTDYTTAGQNPLTMERYYNSQSYTRNITPTIMGANWRTNYDRYLLLASSVWVAAQRPDGQVVNFKCNVTSHVCTPDTDMDYSLSSSGSTWTLTDPDDTVETYSGSGTLGTLSSIKSRNGYTQTMNYTTGVLTSVSDSYSRTLSFTYTGGVLTGVSTPDTATLTYGYSTVGGQSLLSTVKYNTSPNTTQTYLYENTNYPYSLTGITDENGKRYATWTYNGSNLATSSALGGLGANLTQVAFSSTGNAVTGPLGIVDTYGFTTLNNLPKLTSISRAANGTVASASESLRYDSSGYLSSLTDWNGNNTSWVNNSHGRPTQVSFSSNTTDKQITNITYDFWYPRLPHTFSANGLNGNYGYDSSGNLTSLKLTDTTSQSLPYSTNGQTRTWAWTWNSTGQMLTAQMPRTDVVAKTTYTYSGGTLITTTDAMGHVTTVTEAQGGGLWTKMRDPNGIFTTRTFNNRNWLTSSVIATSAGNLTSSQQFDSAGNLTKTTLPDNSYQSYAYDNAHRLITTTNALSETSNITLDSGGNMTQGLLKDSSGNTKFKQTATFDALGRKLTSVDGQGNSTSYTYDKNGNVLTITNPRNYVTTQTWDSLDRLSTYQNAENDLSSLKYDSHSRLLSIKDGRGNLTSYIYNGFGDRIQQNSPDSLKTTFWFDEDSNVTGRNQSGLNFSSATYDKLDRLTAQTFVNDSSLNTALKYDSSGHGFGVGHLTGGTDKAGSFSRSYDERGNVTTDARTIDSNTWTSNYGFDSAGRLSSLTFASSGWLVTYARDAAGQISSVTTKQPGHAATNLATSITHMPWGPASSWTYGNGVTDTRTFDKAYRMTGVKDVGSSNLWFLSYGYDAASNITSITDNVTSANNQTLTWDRIDRIKSASGAYGTISGVAYDSNSNRKTWGASTYTTPGLNDRTSSSAGSALNYDSAGNVTGIGTNSMTYNQANQMATATVSGTTSTYTYGAFGQRLKLKTPGSAYSVDIFNLDGSLQSETIGGTETDYVSLDGMPLYVVQPGAATLSALHTDNVGTVQRATNSSKTIVWTGNYGPFGDVTPTTTITQDWRFLGNINDSTGYNYITNRFKNPKSDTGAGKMLQVDPLPVSPEDTNPYVAYNHNPYSNVDPFGLKYGDVWDPRTYIPFNAAIGGSIEVSYIDSFGFLSKNPNDTGGVTGLNFECMLNGGCHLYTYVTPKECTVAGVNGSKGLNEGLTAQGNFGFSSMPTDQWTGLFDNYIGFVGPYGGTYFQSPGGTGNWWGGGYGLAFPPAGAGYTRTNYDRKYPDSP